uniref:Zgc:112970 n=1 Tax=Nothobranchius kadleci TaxID=1051664 RepID=A0A1A8CAI9_NOTKA
MDDLYQRGLKQRARQKQASPKNQLSVSFIGEQGTDEGALRREFLTEMMRGLELNLFEGVSCKGKTPKYSISYYQENRYRYVQYDAALQCNLACLVFRICGEIIATSLVQGGPAPNFFSTWSYHFLRHGQITNEDVPEANFAPEQILYRHICSGNFSYHVNRPTRCS